MENEIGRLDKYLSMKGINDNEFTVNTGISQGWIGKARRDKSSITDKTRKKILKTYTDLNPVWFQTGVGEMIANTKKETIVETTSQDKEALILEITKLREQNYILVNKLLGRGDL